MYESLCNGVVSEQQRILLGEEEKGIWFGSKHSIATKLDNEYGICIEIHFGSNTSEQERE